MDWAHNKLVIGLFALVTHSVLHYGEWDNSLLPIFGGWILAFSGIAATAYDAQTHGLGATLKTTLSAAVLYFGVLTTSILLHRGFLHRLRKIPGPFFARFSKLHSVFAGVLPDYQYYKVTNAWHDYYKADVIRTGPREVNVYCVDAIPLIHGPNAKCTKSLWYVGGNVIDGVSIMNERDKTVHKQRRRAWDHAFNVKALREYEPRLNRHARALMAQLRDQANRSASVRITNWVNFYSFDVVGDVGFNRSFGMVEKGREDETIRELHESMAPLSILTHLPWALNLIARMMAGSGPLHEQIQWTFKVLRERAKITPKENDIFSWLLDPHATEVTSELNADARLLIVAGSDTTAAALSWIAYELCKNPGMQAKLRKQIDAIAPSKSHLDVEDVSNCAFLDGVINEALRLHPPVPSGVQRETPPEGIQLPNGTYIPGNINVWMPIYSIQRDARCFADPLTFLPERWTDERAEAVIDKRAFMPFSTGAYSCVGQKLAIMELRSVTANLMRSFEMSFADGEDGEEILSKSRDCFSTNVGKLDVGLKPRHEA